MIHTHKERTRSHVPLFGRETLYHVDGESVFHVGHDTMSREPSTGITPDQVRDVIEDLLKMLLPVEE